jgi:hypothetical protein
MEPQMTRMFALLSATLLFTPFAIAMLAQAVRIVY